MFGKIKKIVLDAVLSIVFFIAILAIFDLITGAIFGKTNGTNNTNGGIVLGIPLVLTIVFAIWFYKYVSIKKKEAK